MKKRILLYGFIILSATLLFNGYVSARRGSLLTPEWYLSWNPLVHRLASTVTDLKFKLRGPVKPQAKIVIAAIDTNSLDVLGRWPWRRDILGSLLENLMRYQVKAVGFDILLSEDHSPLPEQLKEILEHRNEGYLVEAFDFDRELGKTVAVFPEQVVLEWHTESPCQQYLHNCPKVAPLAPSDAFRKFALSSNRGTKREQIPLTSVWQVIEPISSLLNTAKYLGFANNEKDSDSVTRLVPLVIQVEDRLYPSFALSLAAAARKEMPKLSLNAAGNGIDSIEIDQKAVPINAGGLIELRHLGDAQTIPHVSVTEILRGIHMGSSRRKLASDPLYALLKDAIVLVGATARGIGDLHATPFGPEIPGVEIQASIVENLLSTRAMTLSTSTIVILNLFLIFGAIFLVWAGEKWEARHFLSVVMFFLLAVFLWDYVYLFRRDENAPSAFLYAELILLAALCLIVKYLDEENKRKFIRAAFSKYVSPAVVDSLIQDPTQLSLGGRRETLTVLFSDIRSFTSFSESAPGKVLSEFLNEFHGLVTEIIFEYGGTLDKYIGDAVMAFWGAPLLQPDHADRALRASIKIAETVKGKAQYFQDKYGFTPRIGVGLHTGEVTVGNMGSERSFGYTVIGDSVNLASRLEGATKYFGVAVLTTRQTIESAVANGRAPLHRTLGRIKAKGKQTDVEVVEILSEPYPEAFSVAFDEGRNLFSAQKFSEAKKQFSKALALVAHDIPCQRYLELCDEHATMSLPSDWNGSWALTEK